MSEPGLRDADADPFMDPDRLHLLEAEILESGFERDLLLERMRELPTCGLNVAMGWPLPDSLRSSYEDLARHVGRLSDGIYVYPFSQTHITLVTAVNFQQNLNPDQRTVAGVVEASKMLGDFIAAAARDMTPFTVRVGPPVLARRAAFLPMLNPTLEVARLRRAILGFCRENAGVLGQARAPEGLHATMLRFLRVPVDPAGFLGAFNKAACRFPPSQVTIDRVLVTLETHPYMWEGRIVGTISLPGGSPAAG